MTNDPNINVAAALAHNAIILSFKRQLVGPLRSEWLDLQYKLEHVTLQPFTLYNWLDNGAINNHEFDVV